jgi:hypothetical protein
MWFTEEMQGDEGAAKLQVGQTDVSPLLVADLEPSKAIDPAE